MCVEAGRRREGLPEKEKKKKTSEHDDTVVSHFDFL